MSEENRPLSLFANQITQPDPNEIVDVGLNAGLVHVEGELINRTYEKVAVGCFHAAAAIPYPPSEPDYVMLDVSEFQTTFACNVQPGSIGGAPDPTLPQPENNNKVVAFYRLKRVDANDPEYWTGVPPVYFYAHETMS